MALSPSTEWTRGQVKMTNDPWRHSRRAVTTMRRRTLLRRRVWRVLSLALVGLSLGAVLVTAWYAVVQPQWLAESLKTREAEIAAVNDGRRTNAQLLAAAFLVVGAWL